MQLQHFAVATFCRGNNVRNSFSPSRFEVSINFSVCSASISFFSSKSKKNWIHIWNPKSKIGLHASNSCSYMYIISGKILFVELCHSSTRNKLESYLAKIIEEKVHATSIPSQPLYNLPSISKHYQRRQNHSIQSQENQAIQKRMYLHKIKCLSFFGSFYVYSHSMIPSCVSLFMSLHHGYGDPCYTISHCYLKSNNKSTYLLC